MAKQALIPRYTKSLKTLIYLQFLPTFTIPPRAPTYIVASIKSDYFGLISTKNIIIRYLEVA